MGLTCVPVLVQRSSALLVLTHVLRAALRALTIDLGGDPRPAGARMRRAQVHRRLLARLDATNDVDDELILMEPAEVIADPRPLGFRDLNLRGELCRQCPPRYRRGRRRASSGLSLDALFRALTFSARH